MSARARKSKHMQQQQQQQAEPDKLQTSKMAATVDRSRTESMSSMARESINSSHLRERSASPLNITRTEEKAELAHLNDRLASYIDYVRQLEREKDIMRKKIHTFSEERMTKLDDSRRTYEEEITSLRRLVDDLSKEKAKGDIETKKHKDDAADAKSKLSKRDTDVRLFQRKVEELERGLANFKQGHENFQSLKPEYDALEKRFETMRRDLEAETILRTDLENKVTGLREEIDFKTRLYSEEREKMIQKTVVVEEEVEDRKAAEYDSRLAEELQAYRQETAQELQEYRAQIEDSFKNQLVQLRTANVDNSTETGKLRDELLIIRKRSDDLAHELAKKSSEVDLLKRRCEDLENLVDRERNNYEKQLSDKRDEVKRLQGELELRFSEFNDLMNTKIALDQEILMYRKMLEGEESRLNIPSPTRVASPFGCASGHKKRRFEAGDDEFETSADMMSSASNARYSFRVSTTAQSGVEFTSDQDGQGKWVKLVNSSNEDISLGNWTLKHQADSQECAFKFHRTVNMKPGASLTVWSSDADATHNPPSDIVMKNQAFKSGANIAIKLLNIEGEEKATCMVVRERVRTAVPFRRLRDGTKPDEKCTLM